VAIGVIVGTLLAALTLWVVFVVWLKRRKREQGFKELGGAGPNAPSPRINRMTLIIPSKPTNQFVLTPNE
jgi:hypothetical protein